MSKPEEVRLKFDKSGTDMIRDARLKTGYLQEDLIDFTKYDEEITLDWVDRLEEKIDAAEAIPIDETVVDVQVGLGKVLDDKMKAGEEHFQDVKYYVGKAFPNSIDVQNEFGFDDYGKARGNVAKFILFLKKVGLKLNHAKYKDTLRAKGMPITVLTLSAALAGEIETADRNYDNSKKGRTGTTQDRRISYNEVWDMLAMLCAAGKNVYRKNYAKYRRYILYEGNQTPPPIGELYEPLPASETATALHEFSTTDTLLFVNAGVTDLRFYRHTVEEEPNGTVGFTLAAQSEIIKPVSDVPGMGDFINVTNLSDTDSGLFLVQLAE